MSLSSLQLDLRHGKGIILSEDKQYIGVVGAKVYKKECYDSRPAGLEYVHVDVRCMKLGLEDVDEAAQFMKSLVKKKVKQDILLIGEKEDQLVLQATFHGAHETESDHNVYKGIGMSALPDAPVRSFVGSSTIVFDPNANVIDWNGHSFRVSEVSMDVESTDRMQMSDPSEFMISRGRAPKARIRAYIDGGADFINLVKTNNANLVDVVVKGMLYCTDGIIVGAHTTASVDGRMSTLLEVEAVIESTNVGEVTMW